MVRVTMRARRRHKEGSNNEEKIMMRMRAMATVRMTVAMRVRRRGGGAVKRGID